MNFPRNSVLVDFERLKYPFTGLYSFSKSLANSLVRLKPDRTRLTFFVPPSFLSHFGNAVDYLIQNPLQKLYFPNSGKFSTWHSTYQGSAYFPRNSSVKIIQTVHDLNFLYERKGSPNKIKKNLRILQTAIDRADIITTISQFTMQEIENHLRLGSQHKEVIYNGFEVMTFPYFQSPVYRPIKPFLFTIGTLLPKKNFHTLPSLLVGNDFELIIAGLKGYPYQEKIWQEAKIQGVSSRVKLLGPIDEENKYWYYKNCLAFVFPSLAEGFGLPVLEAMYFGKPLFLSEKTSLPEIGGNLAYYFNSFEPESMRRVLENGLNTFNLETDSLKLILASQKFSWNKAAQSYLDLY